MRMKWSEVKCYIQPVWKRDTGFPSLEQLLFTSRCSGKLFMGIPFENCREISANCFSKRLRRFVYRILNDAETKAEGNIKVTQEWDREGLSVQQSIVKPYQEGVVPSLSLIPYLDLRERVKFLLFALDSDTTDVRSLGKRFILIASSLRYLIKNAQPPLDTNHLIALLCCCVNMENDEFHNGKETTVSPKRSSWPFDIRAAQSFAQWQCALRDAIHLFCATLKFHSEKGKFHQWARTM